MFPFYYANWNRRANAISVLGICLVILPITEPDVVLTCILCIFAFLQDFEYNCGGERDDATSIVISIPEAAHGPLPSKAGLVSPYLLVALGV